MGEIRWEFPLLGVGNESGNNIAAITMFKGAGVMDGLAREVCQNSLDAKNPNLDDSVPVRIKIELVYLNKEDFPAFNEYQKYVLNCYEYWENSPLRTDKMMGFIRSVLAALMNEKIPVLIISDYNTTGLRGVGAGDDEGSYWNLLVNTDGISIKDNNNSAGSYGIGKNAPFAYSALNTVFYNTLAVDGGRAFEGVARLATTTRLVHNEKKKTQPIGKYLFMDDENDKYRPILPEDNCPLAEYFSTSRKEDDYGTDVAVFGFKENDYPNWQKLMATAVIKNFVLSIYNNKLEIEIKSENEDYLINSSSLEKYLFNDFKDDKSLKYTRQIFSTYTDPDNKKEVTIAEEKDLTIFVKYKETYSQSLSRFRSTGMLINTKPDGSLPHFSVIVQVNDVGKNELSATLREAEPPQHTEWACKNITDNRELHNLAAKYIRNITKEVQKVLDEYDKIEEESIVDAGIGDYLPDNTEGVSAGDNSNGPMTGVTVNEIKRNDGRIVYSRNHEQAEGTTGTPVGGSGFKTGKKKRKKRKQKIRIKPVILSGGNKQGLTPGKGKVRVISPEVNDQRTFYLGGNKYKLYAEYPKGYDKVYISYFASRDDMSTDSDPLIIKNIKVNKQPVQDVNSDKAGPISMQEGVNYIFVEFENHELMAVKPVFTAEVTGNEK